MEIVIDSIGAEEVEQNWHARLAEMRRVRDL
jgi:hypothetical protein